MLDHWAIPSALRALLDSFPQVPFASSVLQTKFLAIQHAAAKNAPQGMRSKELNASHVELDFSLPTGVIRVKLAREDQFLP